MNERHKGPGGFGGADAFAFLTGRRPAPPAPVALRPPTPPAPSPVTPSPAAARAAMAGRVQFQAADQLRRGRSAETLAAAVHVAGREGDRQWEAEGPEIEARKAPPFACKAGCAWCCYQSVAVLPAEALAIVRHIDTQFTPEQRAVARARVAALDDRARGLGAWERARLKEPCAFLVDNACSIYAARPLRCRGVISRDAQHCRNVMENPDEIHAPDKRNWRERKGPYPVEPSEIVDAAGAALARTLNEAGLDWQALEFMAAMRIALETPDAAAQYLAGIEIFAPARLPAREAGAAEPAAVGLAKTTDSA